LDKLVFFHKTPALWNKRKNLPQESEKIELTKLKKKLPNYALDAGMIEFFSTDVYFQMCKEICSRLNIKEFHIVHGYNDGELRNWSVQEEQSWSEIDENTTYWSFTEPKSLLSFMDSSIIITRGNYPVFHHWLSDRSIPHPHRFWLHYPATSLRYPHLDEFQKNLETMFDSDAKSSKLERLLAGMLKEHELDSISENLKDNYSRLIQHFRSHRESLIGGPYNVVLADDKINVQPLSMAFPSAIVQTFVKPVLWTDSDINFVREYDAIFCGTSLQPTKNHQCFVQIVKHLDTLIDQKLKIVIAGNKVESKIFEPLMKYSFTNISIINKGEVSRNELQALFSKSKSMIITSGRDANPRIIQESLAQGARVIAVDTLSDGFEFILSNPLLGAVLKSEAREWKYSRNGNLLFKPSIHLANLVLNEIEKSNFPDLVMKISRKKLSLENSVDSLINTIKSFR
jgi:hypothetical protein